MPFLAKQAFFGRLMGRFSSIQFQKQIPMQIKQTYLNRSQTCPECNLWKFVKGKQKDNEKRFSYLPENEPYLEPIRTSMMELFLQK